MSVGRGGICRPDTSLLFALQLDARTSSLLRDRLLPPLVDHHKIAHSPSTANIYPFASRPSSGDAVGTIATGLHSPSIGMRITL